MAPEVVKGGDAGHDFVRMVLDMNDNNMSSLILNRPSIGGVWEFLHLNF